MLAALNTISSGNKKYALFTAISDNAKRYPSSLALIGPNVVLNYRGLELSIKNIATKALSLDLKPGNSVCVRCRNPNVELLINLGLMRAGMTVAIAAKPEIYADNEFVFDVLITDGGAAKPGDYKAKRIIRLTSDWSEPNPFSKRKIAEKPYSLLFASSGSTGRSKLMLATAENMERRFAMKSTHAFFSGNTRFLSLNQPNSLTSFVDSMLTLMHGGQVIRLGVLGPEQALDAITVYKPTYLCLSPFTLVGMIENLQGFKRRFTRVEFLRVGGAFCGDDVRKRAKELLAENVIISYGSTETSRIAFAEVDEIAEIEGAVGNLVEGYEVEAVGEDGRNVGKGALGELRVKPPAGTTLSYMTRQGPVLALKDGWFYPGDTGLVDENGTLVITGRKNSVINFGGNKLDPERVEMLIRAMDEVEDVVVVPLIGEHGFDVIHCLVKSQGKLKVEDVNKFIVSRRQAFLVQSVTQVEAIPRMLGGKVDRAEALAFIKKQAIKN